MNNPTEAQIKEFWEWCGWKQDSIGNWLYPPQYKNEQFRMYGIPPITLDNLFKYAVPKVDRYRLEDDWSKIEKHFAYAEIGEKSGSAWDKDPALALFRALDKVREE